MYSKQKSPISPLSGANRGLLQRLFPQLVIFFAFCVLVFADFLVFVENSIYLKKSFSGVHPKPPSASPRHLTTPPVCMDLSFLSVLCFVSVLACDIVYSARLLIVHLHFLHSLQAGPRLTHFYILFPPEPSSLSRNVLINVPVMFPWHVPASTSPAPCSAKMMDAQRGSVFF